MARRKVKLNNNLQRWLISYADFITLLFAFFVVMYAISSVNDDKYNVLSETFEKTFKRPKSSLNKLSSKQLEKFIKTSEYSIEHNDFFDNYKKTNAEHADMSLDALKKKVDFDFKKFLSKNLIDVRMQDEWLEVEIESNFLFDSGSSVLTIKAENLIKMIAKSFKSFSNSISVEGFTDDLPINTEMFPSNWELSASRAASVARLLIEEGISSTRLRVIGYGSNHAIASNKTISGRNKNRRVVLVIEKNNSRREYLKHTQYYQNKARNIFLNVDDGMKNRLLNSNLDTNLTSKKMEKLPPQAQDDGPTSTSNTQVSNVKQKNTASDNKNQSQTKVNNKQIIMGKENMDGTIIYDASSIVNVELEDN